jgi:hypothetical protein
MCIYISCCINVIKQDKNIGKIKRFNLLHIILLLLLFWITSEGKTENFVRIFSNLYFINLKVQIMCKQTKLTKFSPKKFCCILSFQFVHHLRLIDLISSHIKLCLFSRRMFEKTIFILVDRKAKICLFTG